MFVDSRVVIVVSSSVVDGKEAISRRTAGGFCMFSPEEGSITVFKRK